jgi:hypothetical protein
MQKTHACLRRARLSNNVLETHLLKGTTMKVIKTAKQFRDYVVYKLEGEVRGQLDDDGFYTGPEEVEIQLCSPAVMVRLSSIRMTKASIEVRKENKALPCHAYVIGAEISSTFLMMFQIMPKQRIADIVEDAK